MVIDTPGKVSDRIVLLGRKESCVYILIGEEECVLLGGGMTYIIPDVISQLQALGIAEKKIKRIIVLHSHFDHCGMVPFLKNRWPWATITASERAGILLSRPDVIESIDRLNKMVLTEYGLKEHAKDPEYDFKGIVVEDVVKGGDVLFCGEIPMEIIDVPGHSSCSIAVYVDREKAMFASDAAGIPCGETVFTAANSNFDKYQESLDKIASYEVDILLAEHFGARTGKDSTHFIEKSIRSAVETRRILETFFAETGDVEQCTEAVADALMERLPEDFMPRDVIALVAGQMVKFISVKKSRRGGR